MDIKVNEVNQTAATSSNNNAKAQLGDDSFKFTLVSNIEEKDLQGKLSALLDDITKQGKNIAEHMDIRDMRKYRSTIKEFLNEVVNRSHEFSRENFLDRRGRHRVYGIIKKVDANLDDLASELIKDEKDHIAILDKVDDIRGLLLDITT